MRILFVVPTLDYADQISVAYLSAVAKKLGHETNFLNLDNKDDVVKNCRCGEKHHYACTIYDMKPDVVAYTTTIQHFEEICYFNARMHHVWEHDFISILGGAHATFAPETFKNSGMDYYCVGEGELAFEIFLKGVEAGLGVTKNNVIISPNIICKNGYNYKNVKKYDLIQDLDLLPFSDRDLTLANSYLKDTPKKTFYTSRGCPYSCSYCANNHYNKMYRGQKIVRRFSVDRIIEEIQYVACNYRCDFIKFGDDLFALKADDWLKEFSWKYKEYVNIPFNCYLRIDSVNMELVQLLKLAGCHSVHLSIDSTSERVREKILKRKSKLDNSEMVERLKLIHSYGIKTWVNYMLAAPESFYADDARTIAMSREGKVSYTSYSMTDPIKGTDLYQYCLEKKYIDKSYSGDMSNCSTRSVLYCFDNDEKHFRYNIYLIGAVLVKLPKWLSKLSAFILWKTKPNRFYEWIHKKYYEYNIEKVIFKL